MLFTASSLAVERTYIDEEGMLVTCKDKESGFAYEITTDVNQYPMKGFICAITLHHAKEKVRKTYNAYGLEIEALEIDYAVDLEGNKKPKKSLSFI